MALAPMAADNSASRRQDLADPRRASSVDQPVGNRVVALEQEELISLQSVRENVVRDPAEETALQEKCFHFLKVAVLCDGLESIVVGPPSLAPLGLKGVLVDPFRDQVPVLSREVSRDEFAGQSPHLGDLVASQKPAVGVSEVREFGGNVVYLAANLAHNSLTEMAVVGRMAHSWDDEFGHLEVCDLDSDRGGDEVREWDLGEYPNKDKRGVGKSVVGGKEAGEEALP